jgi:hypothetical protein
MKTKGFDVEKARKALIWKSIIDCGLDVGAAAIFFALGYPLWGALCILAVPLEVCFKLFEKRIEKRIPQASQFILIAKRLVELAAMVPGGLALLDAGQAVAAAVCFWLFLARVVSDEKITSMIAKKYPAIL